MNRPVVQKTPEVLEQRVLVLVDESVGAVRHLAGVVQDAEVTSKLQRLFRRIRLTVTTTIPLIKIYRACLKKRVETVPFLTTSYCCKLLE